MKRPKRRRRTDGAGACSIAGIAMSASTDPNLVAWFEARLNAWRERRHLDGELSALGLGDADQELAHAGLSRDYLPEIIRRFPEASDLLRRVMTEIGIDHDLLRRGQPETLHHLEFICASCRSWRRCKSDLARGRTNQTLEQYCANAHELRTIHQVMSWVGERSSAGALPPKPGLDM